MLFSEENENVAQDNNIIFSITILYTHSGKFQAGRLPVCAYMPYTFLM